MFEIIVVKRKKILAFVMVVKYSQHTRNRLACEDKWGVITWDFKKIIDCMLGTSNN
jgi:hypothetical protein